MKNHFINLIFVGLTFASCNEKETTDLDFVTTKFQENADKIKIVQYDNNRIDSSMAQNVFWNNKGTAILERKKDDKIHGFSFYGKRTDVENEHLYDNGYGFEISPASKTYEIEDPRGIAGSPGGQMTVKNIFKLDSVYESRELIEEEDRYIIQYTFEPDTVYNVTDQTKVIELRKEDFFPTKITYRSNMLGKSTMYQYNLSNIKINEEVETTIADIKNRISDYEVIQPKERSPSSILNKKFPKINLPNLKDQDEVINLSQGKLILLDFWEVWCGPCIRSFPKIEELHQKYGNNLQVVGIVTQSPESAIKLVDNKTVTFLNLKGDNEIHSKYGVDSFPRYFLIDSQGIVQKEYFGYSENIEKDIQSLIGG